LNIVECCKYLGILIDSDLKWQDHINNIYNKLIKFTSIFYKTRTKLPEEVLRMIYFAFVHSHLSYGIEVYANTTANHLSKLNVLNNRILRIVQKKSIKTHNNDLYKSYFTLPLQLLELKCFCSCTRQCPATGDIRQQQTICWHRLYRCIPLLFQLCA